jgi:centrosomal protein CEP19
MAQPVTLKRCGVRFSPPAVVITYSTKVGKTHRRTMPLRNFNKNSGVERVALELQNNSRHQKYLSQVPLHQLEKMISIIKDKLNGLSMDEIHKKNKDIDKIDPDQDLNKVDDDTLKYKKAVMEQSFEKNRKKPGDADFQYDVEVDFEGGAIESCDWDSENDSNEF